MSVVKKFLKSKILEINKYLAWFDDYEIKPSSEILLMLLSQQLAAYRHQFGHLLNPNENNVFERLIDPKTRSEFFKEVLSSPIFPEFSDLLRTEPRISSYYRKYI